MNKSKTIEQGSPTLVPQSLAPNEETLSAHVEQTPYIRHVMDDAVTKLTWKQCFGLVAGTVFSFIVFRQVFGYAFFVVLYYQDGAFKSDPEAVKALSSLLQMRPDQFFISSLVFTLFAALLVRVKNHRMLPWAALCVGLGPVVPATLNPAPTAAMISRTPSSLLLLVLLCAATALTFHLLQARLRNSRRANAFEVPFRRGPE